MNKRVFTKRILLIWASIVLSMCTISLGANLDFDSRARYDSLQDKLSTTVETLTTEDGFKYKVDWSTETVIIMGYTGSKTEIEIPSVIDRKEVVGIEDEAFRKCENIKSINIPESITSIGASAFSGCTGLTNIVLPSGLTTIKSSTFFDCTSLTKLEIPQNVKEIKAGAFYNCSSLISLKIPNRVTSIENWTFSGCSSLTNILIPNGVTTIGSRAFYNCANLTSLKIPDGVTRIGAEAFSGCSNLEKIAIPNGVTSIEEKAFSNCSNLENIVIPLGVTSLKTETFSNCGNLTSITISSNVINIEKTCFNGCNNDLTILCEDKSYALQYAAENNKKYQIIPIKHVQDIVLNKKNMNINVSDQETLITTITPNDAENKLVTWRSDDPRIVSVDENGKITGLSDGKAIIIVSTIDGNKKATCEVTVTGPEPVIPVSEITLNKTSITMDKGETEELVATVSPTDATYKDLIWYSENEEIAKVDKNGVVTAINTGTTRIKVTTEEETSKAICDVTVIEEVNASKYEINGQNKTIRTPAKTTVKLLIQEIQGNVLKDNEQLEENSLLSTGNVLRTTNGDEYTIIVIGDVNGDAQITPTDLLKVKRHLVGLETLDDIQKQAGDINNAGGITPTDLLQVKRIIVGLL